MARVLGVQQTGSGPAPVAGKLTAGVSRLEEGRVTGGALPRGPRLSVPDPPCLPSDSQLPVYTNVTWKEISLDCDLYLGSATWSTLSRMLSTHESSGHGSGGKHVLGLSLCDGQSEGEPSYG